MVNNHIENQNFKNDILCLKNYQGEVDTRWKDNLICW